MALFDEVGQKMHHGQVILAAAKSSCEQEVVSLRTLLLPSSLWTFRRGSESVQQSLVGQCSQTALQVQQVGGASADACVRVGQPAHDGAGV